MTPGEINDEYSEFVRNKIRQRVKDPVVAEMLTPKDHPFGSKRVPCESGYYEAYNRDNVLLVDVREAPIERITPKGVKTAAAEYELDVIIFATGYDAITGALTRIDIRGKDGQSLKDKFAAGPRNYMGILTAGFPNLFTVNQAGSGNYPRGAEWIVEWVTDCLSHLRDRQLCRIEASREAEDAWVDYVVQGTAGTLRTKATTSWQVGTNIPGKANAVLSSSPDSAPVYRAKLTEVAANGYEGFVLQ